MLSKIATSLILGFSLLACGQNGTSFEGSRDSVAQKDSQDSTSADSANSGAVATTPQNYINPNPGQSQP